MIRRNIYEGPSSCYAIREGTYVRGHGVNRRTAEEILRFLLRDLQRGWTYNHQCQRIPMTWDLFVRRARYLIALARKHYGPAEAAVVARLVNEYIKKAREMVRARAKVAARA